MVKKSPVEMFNELVHMGYIVPADVDPDGLYEPTAYVGVGTTLAFETPPIPLLDQLGGSNAKLGSRTQRNQKRKKRSR